MTRYRIVPDRSRVWIDARSNVHPIHSSTEGIEGFVELELDPGGRVDTSAPVGGELSLPVDRLRAGNRMEDRELQKRIDSRRYPRIEGVLDRIEPNSDPGHYQVRGDVTFRGVTRPYQDGMAIHVDGDGMLALDGSARFDIREHGMDPPRILMLKVDPIVEVRVEIRAVEEEAHA